MVDALPLTVLAIVSGIAGLVLGVSAVKGNYVLVVFLGKLFSSGTATLRYAGIGVLLTLGVELLLILRSPDLGPLLVASLSLAFLGAFAAGVWVAAERFGDREVREVLAGVLDTSFPGRGGMPRA